MRVRCFYKNIFSISLPKQNIRIFIVLSPKHEFIRSRDVNFRSKVNKMKRKAEAAHIQCNAQVAIIAFSSDDFEWRHMHRHQWRLCLFDFILFLTA